MGLLAVFNPSKFWTLTNAAVLTVLLGAVRLLPEVSLLGSYNTTFLAGYPSVWSLWTELVTIEQPGASLLIENTVKKIGLWEITLFVGVVGALFMLYFGMVTPALCASERRQLRSLANSCPDHRDRAAFVESGLPFFIDGASLTHFQRGACFHPHVFRRLCVHLVLAASEFQTWLNARS